MDQADADFIDSILKKYRLDDLMVVDRTRLKESHEAWVWVIVIAERDEIAPIFKGFGSYPKRGIITWSNSD